MYDWFNNIIHLLIYPSLWLRLIFQYTIDVVLMVIIKLLIHTILTAVL
jgi:hypothetical protein